MGNWYSADHINEDHIHTEKTYNIEEPQQKYRLRTVSNRLLIQNMIQYITNTKYCLFHLLRKLFITW